MDSAAKKKNALAMYRTFCQAMEDEDWKYTPNEEKLWIETGAKGEDLPMELHIKINEDLQLVSVYSRIPFTIPEDKRLDLAAAVSVINNTLVHGCFDCNVMEGTLFFRMSSSFMGSLISREVCRYLLYCSCATIDKYNDQFLMLSKGMITLEQFLQAELS